MSLAVPAARAVCPTCRRPEVVCYCRHVTTIETRTRVVILQHPRETDVAINTARIAALCLPDAKVFVGMRFAASNDLEAVLSDPERPAALLYPGPDAIDIAEHPPDGPITLVVIDGTWWQAKNVLRDSPRLAALPRYSFRPPAPSDYRIRKEPHEDFVSTIEAIAHVLGIIEGDPERAKAMLTPFRAMVDAQLEYVRARGPQRRAFTRKFVGPVDPRARLPAILRERAGDLVCVYAEGNAWPHGTTERATAGDDLVHWVAHRLATGESFEAIVAPRTRLAPRTAFHARLSEDELLSGERAASLAERFAAFARPNDVYATWGAYPLRLFGAAASPLEAPAVDLRRAARLYAVSKVGSMHEFLVRVACEAGPALGRGRAGVRLAETVAVARALTR